MQSNVSSLRRIFEFGLDKAVLPVAWYLQDKKMERFGIDRTMRLARRFNRLKHWRYLEYRKRLFEQRFDELIAENGPPPRPPVEMKDGWAIDDSRTAPHLQEMIDAAERIIAERGGKGGRAYGKPFFQDLWEPADAERFPAFVNFATSSTILTTVSRYFGFVPHLATAQPPGFRLNESDMKYDDEPDGPYRSSQLFHRDIHNSPVVYVIVPIRDITSDQGPFCFLPESESDKAAEGLRYGQRGSPYRVTDERMWAVADRAKLIEFVAPAGTILFVDSSRCFHYGSRDCNTARYQLMLAYVSPCRTDFSDVLLKQHRYPIGDNGSRLRRMLVDRRELE